MSAFDELLARSSLGAPRRSPRQKLIASLEIVARLVARLACEAGCVLPDGKRPEQVAAKLRCGRCKAHAILRDLLGELNGAEQAVSRARRR